MLFVIGNGFLILVGDHILAKISLATQNMRFVDFTFNELSKSQKDNRAEARAPINLLVPNPKNRGNWKRTVHTQ